VSIKSGATATPAVTVAKSLRSEEQHAPSLTGGSPLSADKLQCFCEVNGSAAVCFSPGLPRLRKVT